MKVTRTTRRSIPSFSLYGEASHDGARTDALHIEDIPSRSWKYLWNIGVHRHIGSHQCVYVTAGPATVNLEGSHTALDGPALIIIPAGTVHGFEFQGATRGYVLTMDLGRLLSAASANQQAPIAALFAVPRALSLAQSAGLAARAARLFDTLLREFAEPDSLVSPVSGWLACSALWALASHLIAPVSQTAAGHDFDRLRRFRQMVEAHYLQHWTVQHYARRLASSATSLNRLCLSITGATAFDVIQERLALEARRRLVYAAGSVASLAMDLGFKDPAYFSRFFRKRSGLSPTAFRRRQAGQ